jgi:hypothetical protein
VWVGVDDVDVLIIQVEPPEPGHRIATLRRAFDNFEEGAVFVRRPGGSHRASTAELRRLVARESTSTLEPLRLVVEATVAPAVYDSNDPALAEWLRRERQGLLSTLEPKPSSPPTAEALQGLLARLGEEPETRTADAFVAEVDDYLLECEGTLLYAGLVELLEEGSVLTLVLKNPTNKNIPSVELRVDFDGPAFSFDDVPEQPRFPTPPLPWGPRTRGLAGISTLDFGSLSSSLSLPAVNLPGPFRTNNHGSTTVEFDAIDLRPEASVVLESVPFLVRVDMGTDLVGKWRATSSAFDGVTSGEVLVRLEDPASLEPHLPPHFDPLPHRPLPGQ